MNAEQLAKAICIAEGKNPERMFKKKPLYTYSIAFAEDILKNIPDTPIVKKKSTKPEISYDEKLKIGVQAYIDVFNDRTFGFKGTFGTYIPVHQMSEWQLKIHTDSLKAAIQEMLK